MPLFNTIMHTRMAGIVSFKVFDLRGIKEYNHRYYSLRNIYGIIDASRCTDAHTQLDGL